MVSPELNLLLEQHHATAYKAAMALLDWCASLRVYQALVGETGHIEDWHFMQGYQEAYNNAGEIVEVPNIDKLRELLTGSAESAESVADDWQPQDLKQSIYEFGDEYKTAANIARLLVPSDAYHRLIYTGANVLVANGLGEYLYQSSGNTSIWVHPETGHRVSVDVKGNLIK